MSAATAAPPKTRDRILDAAERLFSSQGFAATSLRQIIKQAKVNLASIHYHFGSKNALIQAVFARRIEPVNRERLERLDALEARAGTSLRELVDAFVGPALRLSQSDGGERIVRSLLGRTYVEPGEHIQQILEQQFGEVARRFIAAMAEALPELPREELFWRVHFMIGAMAHTMADTHRLQVISGGMCNTGDGDAVARRLVQFLVAGLRAPLGGERVGA